MRAADSTHTFSSDKSDKSDMSAESAEYAIRGLAYAPARPRK